MLKRKIFSKYNSGFTMIEVVVVVSLSTIVMLAVSNIIINFYKYNDYTVAQVSELAEARRGVSSLIRDLREMTFADNGQFPLVETSTSTVIFFSDIDRDDSVELVEYTLDSTILHKYVYNAVGTTYSTSTIDETYIISSYVQNGLEGTPIFRYYDLNGDEATSTTSIADLRYITLDLTVNVDPVRNPGEYTLRSSAALRNIIETY